jgi:hypothetical protein
MAEAVKSFRLDDGGVVVVTLEREVIDLRTQFQPTKVDPDWTWIDPAGHDHDATLESAEWVEENIGWCDLCRDDHGEWSLRCRRCSAVLEPRRVPDYAQPKMMPGLLKGTMELRRHGSRTDYVLTPEMLGAMGDLADDAKREAWVVSVEAREELIIARDVVFERPA